MYTIEDLFSQLIPSIESISQDVGTVVGAICFLCLIVIGVYMLKNAFDTGLDEDGSEEKERTSWTGKQEDSRWN